MRSVFTGLRFSPALMALGPPWSGWFTVRYIVYFPLLCESPFVSFRSAIRIYATCAVLLVHGMPAAVLSGVVGHVQRLSPPDASAASMAAMTRSVSAPFVERK